MSINVQSITFPSDRNSGIELIGTSHSALVVNNTNLLDITTTAITASQKVILTTAAVTQLTSNTTAVTSNTQTCVVTLFGASTSTSSDTFKFNNSLILSTSTVIASVGQSGTNSLTAGSQLLVAVNNVAVGSCYIQIFNIGGTSTSVNPVTVNITVCN